MSPGPAVLDSSVWIEILGSGPLERACQREMARTAVIVPTLVLFEVYRKISTMVSEDQALMAVGVMAQHEIADLTQEIALSAADLSTQHALGMADSMVLAHAQAKGAILVTLDNDFAGLPGVSVLRKK